MILLKKAKQLVAVTIGFIAMTSSLYAQQFRNNNKDILEPYVVSADSLIALGDTTSFEQLKESLVRPKPRHVALTRAGKKKLSSEQVYERALQSTVIIGNAYLCPHCSNTHVNGATGYIIADDGIVVTNSHVVESYINMSEGNKPLAFLVRLHNGRTYPVTKVLAISEKDDLAVLKVETNGDRLPSLGLSKGAAIGEDAYVLGHPRGMYYFFTKGVVNAKFQEQRGSREDRVSYDVMAVSADYAAGSSGGPVLDTYGNIIGTVSSTRTIQYNDAGRSVQMVLKTTIPVESLRRLLDGLKEGKANDGQQIAFLNRPRNTSKNTDTTTRRNETAPNTVTAEDRESLTSR